MPPWNAIWNATRIAPWHPFSGFCWRYACLPVLTLGIQCPGDAVTTMLPAGIRLGRESASLVCAVKGRLPGLCGQGQASGQSDTRPTEGIVRVCNGAVQCSDGQGKKDADQYPPIDQRVRHRRRWWPSHAMAVAKALHRLCASSPRSAWAFLGLSGLEKEYGFRWAL